MEAGQVRSVYLTLRYHSGGDTGVVLHKIPISKDGTPLLESTPDKPEPPNRLLFDNLPAVPFMRCERIGSKLYLFGGETLTPRVDITGLGYVLDAKSSSEELVKFHDLPHVDRTSPYIITAHGRLYHLAIPRINSSGPLPFQVYEPSTKSWDPLPPLPQCPSVPYDEACRKYLGYAVWGSCILVSLWYVGMSGSAVIFVPVLYNAESRTWHQVSVKEMLNRLYGCFPWHGKAVVVGDTIYALGFKKGTIMSFSITKSGSEEDSTLTYSLTTPYKLKGLNIISHPKYKRFDQMFQCWCPLGDLELCLVQTMDFPDVEHQCFFITTFKIIHQEGKSRSHIETLGSTVLCMRNQGYHHFWPLFCYYPDYEPEEDKLTLKVESCNAACLKPDFELRGDSSTKIKGKKIEIQNNPGMVDSNSCKFEPEESIGISRQVKCHKRKGAHSKKKGSEGPKRDQVSTVKLYGRGKAYVPVAWLSVVFMGLTYGLFSLGRYYSFL